MLKNIENQHLSNEELRRLYRDPLDSVSQNDHLKICEWCGDKYNELIDLSLRERARSNNLFSGSRAEAQGN